MSLTGKEPFFSKYAILVYSLIIPILLFSLIYLSQYHSLSAQSSKPFRQFQLPPGTHPHDVAVDQTKNGPLWFTAQGTGELGKLDPKTGNKTFIPLGNASGPHMNGSAP